MLNRSAASPWVENEYVRTRLLSSHTGVAHDPTVLHYLGWEIELKVRGWKTYWRTPGDAGNPPRFNWQGSQNLGKVDVYFPKPERFQIFGIQTFGYGERVILPIRIEPQIGGAAIKISLQAEFMACKEICIPFTANYELNLPAPTEAMGLEHHQSNYADEIRDFVLKVPVVGADSADTLQVTQTSIAGIAGQEKISLHLQGRRHLAGADAFIEAASHFRFGAPQKQLLADGNDMILIFPVHSIKDGASLRGEEITITLIDGWGFAREQVVQMP